MFLSAAGHGPRARFRNDRCLRVGVEPPGTLWLYPNAHVVENAERTVSRNEQHRLRLQLTAP